MEKFDIVFNFEPYSDKINFKGYIMQNPKITAEVMFYYLTEPKSTKKAIENSFKKRDKEAKSKIVKELTEKYKSYLKFEKCKVAVNKIYSTLKCYTDKDLHILFFGEVLQEYRFTTEEQTFYPNEGNFLYGLNFKVTLYKNKKFESEYKDLGFFYPTEYDKNYTVKEIEKDIIRIRTKALKNIKKQVIRDTFRDIEASLCKKYTDPFNHCTQIIQVEEDFDEITKATKIDI